MSNRSWMSKRKLLAWHTSTARRLARLENKTNGALYSPRFDLMCIVLAAARKKHQHHNHRRNADAF